MKPFYLLLSLCLTLVFISCDKNTDDINSNETSNSGSVVTVHVCNATTKSGHYIYRVKIDDNFTNKCLLNKLITINNSIDTKGSSVGTYKDFKITANPKYKKNNWTVTIYAKGGTYGSKSNDKLYQPYSNIENKIYCYWKGTYISTYY
jgi:hypothetical protein